MLFLTPSTPTLNSSPSSLGRATLNLNNIVTVRDSTSTCKASHLSLWTVSEIAEAVHGQIVKWGCPGTISTDARTLQPTQWFFAIAGPKFDAHDFITPQLSKEKRCSGVIANWVCPNWDKGFVHLQPSHPPLSPLTSMALYARNSRFPPGSELVGVTGSVGKTTTTEMIAQALQNLPEQWQWVHRTSGNRNNGIGVALTLLDVPSASNGAGPGVAVVVMGMSQKGEILELARMARPSVVLILNWCL